MVCVCGWLRMCDGVWSVSGVCVWMAEDVSVSGYLPNARARFATVRCSHTVSVAVVYYNIKAFGSHQRHTVQALAFFSARVPLRLRVRFCSVQRCNVQTQHNEFSDCVAD